jgi:hypothetical protein
LPPDLRIGTPTGKPLHSASRALPYWTVQSESAAVFGTNVDIGKGITNLLITNLVKDGTYSIIERAVLDKVSPNRTSPIPNRRVELVRK